jgi:hypothetical protein
MWRPAVPPRVLVLTVAASAGAGLGLGALSACSSGGTQALGTAPAAATVAAVAAPVSLADAPASPPAAPGPVTADQASAIAVQASPGGSVTEVEQETEQTGPVFDVKIQHPDGTETKVEVDANTGRVISTETDGQDGQDEQNEPADDPQ